MRPVRTLVLQSYRQHDVPEWIRLCLDSIEAWTKSCRFDYEFLDDRFFDYAPGWFREKCGVEHFYPVTDIARLHALRERLRRGYDRVIWFDADVLIFTPSALQINPGWGYAFCHEVMLSVGPERIVPSAPSLNNAVMVFEKGNPMLDFYLFAAEQIVRHLDIARFSRTMIGPEFLRGLERAMPINFVVNVGQFTPPLLAAFASGDPGLPAIYRRAFGYPIAAANLCHFVRREAQNAERAALDALFLAAARRLLQSGGSVANPPVAQ
jgi:hypothetical protein